MIIDNSELTKDEEVKNVSEKISTLGSKKIGKMLKVVNANSNVIYRESLSVIF